MNKSLLLCFVSPLLVSSITHSQIVINEFSFDDGGTDDREFIELYNAGASAVDISSWVIGGYDPTTTNGSTTIPNGTSLSAGSYYVVGNSNTLNVNHIVTANFLENDNEVITLRNNGGLLIDAVAYETNKGTTFLTTGTTAPADKADVATQVGTGVFGNSQTSDTSTVNPFTATVSLGRFIDGRDSNNNGRDFGLRPSTPGSANSPGGVVVSYGVPNPSSLTIGDALASSAGSFVGAKVIDPTVVDASNPNAIASPGGGITKAYVAWDPSGGGNGVTSTFAFDTTAAFSLKAYFDTRELGIQTNAAAVSFKGSEITMYGIGSGDALTNLTDLSGNIGLTNATLPAAESANGFTGVAWIYEKAGIAPGGVAGSGVNKLYLVDANDGGDSHLGGNTPLDWTILASYTLPLSSSGDWYDLSLSLNGTSGMASFNGQVTNFTTSGFSSGAFNVGYRENLQLGSDGTPDSILRPATFTMVPEPTTSALFALALAAWRRRRS